MTIMGKNLTRPGCDGASVEGAVGARRRNVLRRVAPLASKDWLVVTVIPESDFTATIVAGTERLAVLLLALVAAVGIWR